MEKQQEKFEKMMQKFVEKQKSCPQFCVNNLQNGHHVVEKHCG